MILVQDIVNEMASALDAEGSDYYNFDRDYKPAINRSVRWLTSVLERGLGDKKYTEQQFRDLSRVRVFLTSRHSRISLTDQDVWSILAVMPLPNVNTTPTVIIPINDYESSIVPNVSHLSSDNYASRFTVEEWNINKGNPFSAGYEGGEICDDLKTYSYLASMDYSSTSYSVVDEIEIRPFLSNKLCSIAYIKIPTEVSLLTDNVEFPGSLFNLVVEKALAFISYKQGDMTNIYSVSNRDVSTLVNVLN